jgi:acetyl esterase/lipase
MFLHGGGWVAGNKEAATNLFLPHLQRGWDVVNVEYRLAGSSLAPAAVEDARCALRWIYNNANAYHFDTERIVVSGQSAGGHLVLMVGMLLRQSLFLAFMDCFRVIGWLRITMIPLVFLVRKFKGGGGASTAH